MLLKPNFLKNNKPMFRDILVFALVVLLPLPTLAFNALTGNYNNLKTGDTMTVMVKNAQNARINYKAAAGYTLLENDTVWLLDDAANGWYLKDYAEALRQYKAAGDPRLPHADISFSNTGQTEIIGGLEGIVFEITDRRARTTYKAVLCDNEDLFAVSQVILLMYSDLNAPPGQRSSIDKIIYDTGINYGVLRLEGLLKFEKKQYLEYDEAYLNYQKI